MLSQKLKSTAVVRSLKNNFPHEVIKYASFGVDVNDDTEVVDIQMTYRGEEFSKRTDCSVKLCPETRQPMKPALAIYRAVDHFKECVKDVDAKLAPQEPVLDEQDTEVDNVSESESTPVETPLNAPKTATNEELTPQQKAVITRKANAAKKAAK